MNHFANIVCKRNGITHSHFLGAFNTCNNITHIPGFHISCRRKAKLKVTHFICTIIIIGADEFNHVAFFQRAIEYTVIGNDPPETIKNAIEYQGLQGSIYVARGSRNSFYNRFKDFFNSNPAFSAR